MSNDNYTKRSPVGDGRYDPMHEPRFAEIATFMRAPLAESLDDLAAMLETELAASATEFRTHGVAFIPGLISPAALELMRSYLRDRYQRTRLSGGRLSSWSTLDTGCAQGAVWSPALFAAVCADLPQHVTAGDVVCYADDVTI